MTSLRILLLVMLLSVPATQAMADARDDARAASQRGDFATAFKLWLPLAEQGDAQAQYNVGFMYDNGMGTAQNLPEAVKWYGKSASQGFAAAETNLGVLHATARGVPQDYAKALEWYQKAADRGFSRAQNNLGGMYENAWGVAQDDALAARWYRAAADQALGNAQSNLARFYEQGRGVPQDVVQAYMWYSLASKNGDTAAAASRDKLAPKLTPAQIAKANELSAAWKPQKTGQNMGAP